MRVGSGLFLAVIVLSGSAAGASARIAPGVHFVPGTFEPGRQPDGNSVVFETTDGPVVVDTGRHEAHTRALMNLVKARGKSPAAIINTHWHLDHVSGNAMLRAAYPGVTVYGTNAIERARAGFLANYRQQLVEMIGKATDEGAKKSFEAEVARIDSGEALMPTEQVKADQVLEIGGRTLEVRVTDHAVTDADLWVFDPQTKVLVAGDLVTLPVPFLDTACPEGWRGTLDALAAMDFEILVPGHGAPMSREQFEIYRAAFGSLLSCAGRAGPVEECVTGWLTDAKPLLAGANPAFARSLAEYYAGLLRAERAEANCRTESATD